MMMMKQQQAMAAQQGNGGRVLVKGPGGQQQVMGGPVGKGVPNLAGMTPQQQAAAQQEDAAATRGDGGAAARGGNGQPGQRAMTEEQIKKAYIVKQQRWLLFLRHASKCQAAERQCQYTPHCHVAKSLWEHVLKCTNPQCQYPRCLASRELLKHHQNCKDARCPVCGPVRSAMLKQRSHMLMQQQQQQAGRGPAKRARIDGAAAPAGPLPTTVRGTVGQKRPGGEGTSLLECFTPDEVRTHLASLRLSDANPAAKGQPMSARRRDAESEKAIVGITEQACRACGVERLTFEPPPLYCYSCVARIKRGQVYYHIPPHVTGGEVRKDAWCNACYNAINGSIEVEGTKYAKSQLAKKKNDDDLEEPWVQCDYCNGWYHQICVLFNGRRNEGGEAPFTCPSCILSQLEKKERTPTTTRPSSQLPASVMPQTRLSYFLEERLRKVMGHERNERARQLGKPVEEVPAAEGLTIRVVSSVEKKLETKQHFMNAFKDQKFPSEFPYRSKVLLLFQKIEGVDVCLLGIYVQEYGSDCPAPNNRRVYLSYLDSVKYFRPSGIQVAAEGGGALRHVLLPPDSDRVPAVHQTTRLHQLLHLGVPSVSGGGLHPVLPPEGAEDAQERQAPRVVSQDASSGAEGGHRPLSRQPLRRVSPRKPEPRHRVCHGAAVFRRRLLPGCRRGLDPGHPQGASRGGEEEQGEEGGDHEHGGGAEEREGKAPRGGNSRSGAGHGADEEAGDDHRQHAARFHHGAPRTPVHAVPQVRARPTTTGGTTPLPPPTGRCSSCAKSATTSNKRCPRTRSV